MTQHFLFQLLLNFWHFNMGTTGNNLRDVSPPLSRPGCIVSLAQDCTPVSSSSACLGSTWTPSFALSPLPGTPSILTSVQPSWSLVLGWIQIEHVFYACMIKWLYDLVLDVNRRFQPILQPNTTWNDTHELIVSLPFMYIYVNAIFHDLWSWLHLPLSHSQSVTVSCLC